MAFGYTDSNSSGPLNCSHRSESFGELQYATPTSDMQVHANAHEELRGSPFEEIEVVEVDGESEDVRNVEDTEPDDDADRGKEEVIHMAGL